MAISPQEIADALRQQIEGFQAQAEQANVGHVLEVSDGVARLSGLSQAMAGELLAFPHDVTGMALNLEEDTIGAVILGDYLRIEEGDEARTTGRVAQVTARGRSTPLNLTSSRRWRRASHSARTWTRRCRPG